MSFVATANAVSHLGATPHFIDVENKSLGISAIALEKRLNEIGLKKMEKYLIKKLKKNFSFGTMHVFEILQIYFLYQK